MPILVTPDWRVDFQLAEFFYGLNWLVPHIDAIDLTQWIKTWCRFFERRWLRTGPKPMKTTSPLSAMANRRPVEPDAVTKRPRIARCVAALPVGGRCASAVVVGSPIPSSSGSTCPPGSLAHAPAAAVTAASVGHPATFRLRLDVGMRAYDQPRHEGEIRVGLRDPGFRSQHTT